MFVHFLSLKNFFLSTSISSFPYYLLVCCSYHFPAFCYLTIDHPLLLHFDLQACRMLPVFDPSDMGLFYLKIIQLVSILPPFPTFEYWQFTPNEQNTVSLFLDQFFSWHQYRRIEKLYNQCSHLG